MEPYTPDDKPHSPAFARCSVCKVPSENLGDRPAVDFVDPNEVVEIPEHKHEPDPPEPLAAFHGGDLVTDTRGFPWDPRIHSRTESKTEDGAWKLKRGVSATLVTAVEKELMSHSTLPVQHPETARVGVDGIPSPVSINCQTPPPPAVPVVPEPFLTPVPYPHTIYADDKAITIASPGAEPVIDTVELEEQDSYEDNMLWLDVMGRLTTVVRDKLITHAEVKILVQSVGVESVPLLQLHTQVIPEFLQKLEHFLKTKGQS